MNLMLIRIKDNYHQQPVSKHRQYFEENH